VLGLREGGVVRPGEDAELTVDLGKPVAMTVGLGFAVREGGRTVPAGTVAACTVAELLG